MINNVVFMEDNEEGWQPCKRLCLANIGGGSDATVGPRMHSIPALFPFLITTQNQALSWLLPIAMGTFEINQQYPT
jgi:hypothetical protein